jgi:DNA-binding HxlR family transcriptional regulator
VLWTLLIIRELLMGGSRFNEIHRGLSLVSPSLLSKRLDSLVDHGLVMKKKIAGQRGHEYFSTECCRELQPIILLLGDWGMRWARSNQDLGRHLDGRQHLPLSHARWRATRGGTPGTDTRRRRMDAQSHVR